MRSLMCTVLDYPEINTGFLFFFYKLFDVTKEVNECYSI